jgi:hypothetical protein
MSSNKADGRLPNRLEMLQLIIVNFPLKPVGEIGVSCGRYSRISTTLSDRSGLPRDASAPHVGLCARRERCGYGRRCGLIISQIAEIRGRVHR